jgi:hypothetical protein
MASKTPSKTRTTAANTKRPKLDTGGRPAGKGNPHIRNVSDFHVADRGGICLHDRTCDLDPTIGVARRRDRMSGHGNGHRGEGRGNDPAS